MVWKSEIYFLSFWDNWDEYDHQLFDVVGIKFTNLQTEDDAKEFFIMAANPEINQEMCILMKRLWEDSVSTTIPLTPKLLP